MRVLARKNEPRRRSPLSSEGWIPADWPAPLGIRAGVTTRLGGVSRPPYDGFNLAAHVDDDPVAVEANRARLREALGLTREPLWLTQVHGCAVAEAGQDAPDCTADAAVTSRPGEVCAVLTADCLPVLLCNRAGTRVAAAHAGWRGLVGGVIEAALARFDDAPADLLCWLGPAIGPAAFEVGEEVRAAFVEQRPEDAACFIPSENGRWLADLFGLARGRLRAAGVEAGAIHGGRVCTFSDPHRFYSYRREATTGRMASLIWIEP